MKILFLVVFTMFGFIVVAQEDSSKIHNATSLNKGFYKTYEEYINNKPSITLDFAVIYKTCKKSDSAIISVNFELINSKEKVGNVWGFCDGKDVFIKRQTGLNSNKYWKIQQLGNYPLYYYFEKSFGFGDGLVRLASFAITNLHDDDLILAYKDENDKNHSLSKQNLKKLLIADKELLDKFEQEFLVAENETNNKLRKAKKEAILRSYLLLISSQKRTSPL